MMCTEDYEKEQKKRKIESAKAELSQFKAALILVGNNTLACEIHIAGMKVGICDNRKVIPALNCNIKQIEKFLEGKPNKWE